MYTCVDYGSHFHQPLGVSLSFSIKERNYTKKGARGLSENFESVTRKT